MDKLDNIQCKTGIDNIFKFEEPYLKEGLLSMDFVVKNEHLNRNNTMHGGIMYTICDEMIGMYSTYIGRTGAAMDGSMHYYKPGFEGDRLTATLHEKKVGKRVGVFEVELVNEKGDLVADSKYSVMFND